MNSKSLGFSKTNPKNTPQIQQKQGKLIFPAPTLILLHGVNFSLQVRKKSFHHINNSSINIQNLSETLDIKP